MQRVADDDRGSASGAELREVLPVGDERQIARASLLDGHESENLDVPVTFEATL
jgi:hypothetical protein